MFRATAIALLALLLGLAAVDEIWCVEECDRAAAAAGENSAAPSAPGGTCLYCPPGVPRARVAIVAASVSPLRVDSVGEPETSAGVNRPIEHPPRTH